MSKPTSVRVGAIALVCAATFALSPAALSAMLQGPGAVAAAATTTVASETVVYSFCGHALSAPNYCSDPAVPTDGLIQASDGNFYGTTGGLSFPAATANGGAVFKITPSGALTTLYSFCSWKGPYIPGGFPCLDGADPTGLIQGSDGNFYGTTYDGGAGANPSNGDGVHAGGTVFKITPTGTLTTLHSFCNQTGTTSYGATTCLDGDKPKGKLIQANDGNFYGTTSDGGANGAGTVFKITPSGELTTLYSFCSQTGPNGSGGLVCLDGASPQGGLIQASDGNFYGTGGSVFKITPAGALTTLYLFCRQPNLSGSGGPICPDGQIPVGLIQASDSNFYGTTYGGGANPGGDDGGVGAGTVFKITPTGALTTLYSFCSLTDSIGNCVDGQNPNGGLIQASDGNFYGTTLGGGASDVLESVAGTVFQITPAGALTTLYSFCTELSLGESGFCFYGGDAPQGSLLQASDGDIYGTSEYGGLNDGGTVFKLSLSLVTPAPATLTVSPRNASFGNAVITGYRAKTFEVRAKTSTKSERNSVFLENFSIKPGNSQDFLIDFAATSCVRGRPLATGSTCKIMVLYAPLFETSKGQYDTATLELTTNAEKTKPAASGSVVDVMLKGQYSPLHSNKR